MRPTHRAAAATLALALPISLGACGAAADREVSPLVGESVEPAAADDPSVGDPTPDPADAVPVARAVDGVTERTVAHQAADITVSRAEVSTETPRSWTGETAVPEHDDTARVYVQVAVANRLLNTGLLLQSGIYLDLGDGLLLENVVRSDASRTIAAGAVADGWYGFELPDPEATLDDAVLVLGEPDRRQDLLPLTGEVPAPDYPRIIEVSSPGTVPIGPVQRSRGQCPVDIEVTEATLAHWVGFDEGGRSHTTSQAEAGSLMLRLDMTVAVPADFPSCYIDTGQDLRLVIDGDRRSVSPRLNETGTVAGGSTEPQYVVYEVPADAEVELEWGRLDSETVRIAIPVP